MICRSLSPGSLACVALLLAACSGSLSADGDDTGNDLVDTDGDGVPDSPGVDTDGDGVPDNGVDPNTPLDPNDPSAAGLSVGWSSRVPRLTHRQWENSVRDLLHLDDVTGLSSAFTPDPSTRFDTNVVSSKITAGLWTDYQTAAESVAKMVTDDAGLLARITPANLPADLAGQASVFVNEFGHRAFRRPLQTTEVDSLIALFQQGTTLEPAADPFAAGVELVLRAVLQSPYFLYRLETSDTALGNAIALSSHEIATRLSYALINSTPPDDLLAAADAGEVSTPEQIAQWAQTLLALPGAETTVVAYHEQLFRIAGYGSIGKDPELFPTFSTALAPTLREEARLFLDDITVTQNGGLSQLLTASSTYVNEDLAPFYGLQGDFGPDFEKVQLDPAQRAGILTQLGFLATYGTLSQSDPIHRGVLISSNILCRELMPPNVTLPPLPAQQAGQTNRERIDQHTSACGAGCHDVIINPLGFAFEHYDAVGQWRDTDNGQPVDSSSSYPLDGQTVSFNDAVELSSLIAQSPAAHSCYATHWLEYALGRSPAAGERPEVETLAQNSLQGASSKALLAEIVGSAIFRTRALDGAEGTP